jgi:hypothetical protein
MRKTIDDEVWDLQDMATYLHVKKDRVRALIKLGELPAFQILYPTGRYMVLKSTLLRYLEQLAMDQQRERYSLVVAKAGKKEVLQKIEDIKCTKNENNCSNNENDLPPEAENASV